MKNIKYIAGVILIGIAFIFCVLSFWLLYYGFIVFVFGATLVAISEVKSKTKLLTIILPVLIYLPITYVFLLVYNYTTPKTFLIPADYEGTIRIIYEEKCGVKLHKQNGRQIFQIPESGILILNENFDGRINHEYYLVDKKGNKTKVNEILDYKDRTRNLPSIQVGGSGTLSFDSTKDITFSDFYLYKIDTSVGDDYKLSKKFDSLTFSVVQACRKK